MEELQIEYDLDLDEHKHYCSLKSVFSISSCWLYLFDTQIAMLTLRMKHEKTEAASDRDMSSVEDPMRAAASRLDLRKVLKIQDIIRRVYSPYWDTFASNGRVHHKDAHVPHRMTLVFKRPGDGDSPRTVSSSFGNFDTEKSSVEKVKQADFSGIGYDRKEVAAAKKHLRNVFWEREPYTVEVWRELLWPLLPTQREGGTKADFPLCFEQIEDDRAMLMSYIAVGNPPACDGRAETPSKSPLCGVRRIKTGDWLRLAMVDDPGDSDRYPYSPSFYEDPENPLADFAYDRFWHPTGKAPGQDDIHSTRWLCSGYGFVGVGDASSKFFTDGHSGALCHFGHHYFALAMIAQFHRSSLLNYKHRLAEAADTMLQHEEPSERLRQIDFREKAERLAKEMMRFRTLYWFTEVSNQIQGQELFNMFREHLNLQKLFDDVHGDADAAVGLLRQWDADDESRASQSLAVLAAIFLFLQPLIPYLEGFDNKTKLYACASATVLAAGLVLLFVRIPSAWLVRRKHDSRKILACLTRWLARRRVEWKWVVCLAMIMGGFVGVRYYQSVSEPASDRPGQPAVHKPRHDASPDGSNAKSSDSTVTPGNSSGKSTPPGITRAPSVPADASAFDAPSPSSPQSSAPASADKSEDKIDTASPSKTSRAAPQKPDSGSKPPDQDSGGGGDSATNP